RSPLRYDFGRRTYRLRDRGQRAADGDLLRSDCQSRAARLVTSCARAILSGDGTAEHHPLLRLSRVRPVGPLTGPHSYSRRCVRDAEAVVQRVGWREFAMNAGGGGSPAAIAFAARHPEQVSRLALADGFARANDMLSQPQVQALIAAAKLDWILATEAIGTAAFGAGREESSGYGAYIRSCIDPEYTQNTDVLAAIDVSELAGAVK